MNEILLALLAMIVLWSVMWWIIKRKHDETYKEILITYPFEGLKKGRTAIFRSGEGIKVGDFVLIRLPGYEMIWRVTKVDGVKLWLVNRNHEELTGFPSHHIWGKMVGYKGDRLDVDDDLVYSDFIGNVPNYDKGIFNKKNNKEN